uniref:Uncharacterized protein n=1 Tax=Anguilla anguilla TaxID=7936 RepID=A0A0E9PZA4_ANGAN
MVTDGASLWYTATVYFHAVYCLGNAFSIQKSVRLVHRLR